MEANEQIKKIDTSAIESLLIGRVFPHIYAFSTKTIPNYWKIGDTVRPVSVRLSEWRKHFEDLTQEYSRPAKVGDKFFRDYAVHSYLERELGKKRLQKESLQEGMYYSNEFFKDVNTEDIENAFNHIEQNAQQNGGLYQLYNEAHLPVVQHYERDVIPYSLRPNQDAAVKAFLKAIEKGRTKLLMYAVMRFGKSFTSMCCAKEMKANIVVIVSGKADVKEEWKKTVEKIANFDGFVFIDGNQLARDENIVKSQIESNKQVAVFLTLQDLKGKKIKEKHKEVFENQIDLLIVDETHYGARAAEYGKVLQNAGLTATQINEELKQKDIESIDDIEEEVKKHLNARITLHLSGTPYRILMSSEFSEEDIISFCQFTDIIDESEKWVHENDLKEDPQDEWENPYYGFPQMIRFAFSLNESSLRKIKQLKEQGSTSCLSALLRPKSIEKDSEGNYKKFEHEAEVRDLLRAIDGSQKDENIFPFLNYDKIREGEMCHHMVFVLPFRASCDAMQELITNESDKFENLSQYEIINIAGVDGNTTHPSVEDIKSKIKTCESQGKKTITLTVNRMLTGNTVEEWDTMIFLKDTASPQEYDQAIFRLQNQYVVTYKDADGKTIKYNKKPQTLLVDFDVDRMFRLQELKSQFYNANTDASGNEKLESRLRRELEISPIICLNKDRLQQVTSANIMDAVREYSQSRSVMDEATDIPVDDNILADDEILAIIKDLVPIDSKKGITFRPVEGEDDIDIPEDDGNIDNDDDNDGENEGYSGGAGGSEHEDADEDQSGKEIAKKLQTYYLQILFFAFLTESKVKNLGDVISVIYATEDNKRIARNLGLNRSKLEILHSRCSHFIHSRLDYKIENINNLICDQTMDPIKRAEVALTQFGRMSDSEIVTPKNIAAEMIAILPEIENLSKVRFLDIASKQGEFAYALYNRYANIDDAVRKNIYSLPTSPLCYEFTRKIYKLLDMPIENIIADFTSYNLIEDNNEEYIKKLQEMKFTAIVGNPPYQINDGSGASDDASNPIYHSFVRVAKNIAPTYISMIMPAKWMVGGKVVLKSFRKEMMDDVHISKMVDYENDREVFPSAHNDGGICYFLYDKNHDDGGQMHYVHKLSDGTIVESDRTLKDGESDIIIRDYRRINIIEKVRGGESFKNIVSQTRPFGVRKDLFNSPHRYPDSNLSDTPFENSIRIYGVKGIKGGARRLSGYISDSIITRNKEAIGLYKLYFTTSFSTNAITPPEAIMGGPNTACTETFLVIGPFDTEDEQVNCQKYIQTDLFKILLHFGRGTMQVSQDVFRFIPLQDFTDESDIKWNKSVAEINKQLYKKYRFSKEEISFIESKVRQSE